MSKAQYSTLVMVLLSFVVAARAQGFYRIGARGGRAVLVRPDGTTMALRARAGVHLVTAETPRTDLSPVYVDQRTAELINAMKRAGFNAVGAGSDAELWHRGLPYIEDLALSQQLASAQGNGVVDVYAANFRAQVRDLIEVAVRPRLQDRTLIGYMSDANVSWGPNRDPEKLLRAYLALPWTGRDGGREHAVDYLRQRYGSSIGALQKAWRVKASDFTTVQAPEHADAALVTDAAEFAAEVLARYLSVVAAELRQADPNHLFLGTELRYSDDRRLGSIWAIADVAVVDLQPGQQAARVAAALAQMTPRPIVMASATCRASRPARVPQVVGYICP